MFLRAARVRVSAIYRYVTVRTDNVWGGINLWETLLERVKGGSIDAVLHCGDQVSIVTGQ